VGVRWGTPAMKRSVAKLILPVLAFAGIFLGACASDSGGSTRVYTSVYMGYGYYNPYYWRHYWYRPPYYRPPGYRPPAYRPPRPVNPIARPPHTQPATMPSANPASRPATRPATQPAVQPAIQPSTRPSTAGPPRTMRRPTRRRR
jgi:hypothetical protein